MKRISALNRFQKSILLLMAAMSLVFAVLSFTTISRVGFEYNGVILTPGREGDSTTYSGVLQGQPVCFTVSGDQTIVFQAGDTVYEPYTVREDASAVPESHPDMTGVELRQGEEILFRGGFSDAEDFLWLYNEDGTLHDFMSISYMTGDGVLRDENGVPIDPTAPTTSALLRLIYNPELTHHGAWIGWCAAVFICLLNALTILFADELFRWRLSFQIQDAAQAEPSDWAIAGRYAGWVSLLVIALACFITGLK